MSSSSFKKAVSSLPFRLLLVLLSCVLSVMALLYSWSADRAWDRYEPWFGEPEKVERHMDTGATDIYLVSLSEEQLADWEQTFQLKSTIKPTSDNYRVTSASSVQLVGSSFPEQRYSISLQRPSESWLGEASDDMCDVIIQVIPPSEVSSLGVISVDERFSSWVGDFRSSLLGLSSSLIFLFLPALLARLFMRRREGLFPPKELLFNYLGACLFYLLINTITVFALLNYTSSLDDRHQFVPLGILVVCPFVNAFSCLILYLIIGLYRWWRQRRL